MKKKRTQEEFEQEVYNINSNIKILTTFKATNEKVDCLCTVDGNKWSALPSNLLKGKGCPVCGIKSRISKRRKSQKDFELELFQFNKHIKLISEYKNSYCKLDVKCDRCGFQFSRYPNKIDSFNCPYCDGNKRSHDDFIREMSKRQPHILISNYYINGESLMNCTCNVCNHKWSARARKLIEGSGCPNCAHLNHRLSNEEFESSLKKIFPHIRPVTPYLKSIEPITVKCDIDGHIWTTTPNSLLSGIGCKICANNKMKLNQDEFESKLRLVNDDIIIIGKYVNYITHIEYKCKNCGNIHSATPSNLLSGYGCPVCKISKGEKKCKMFFESNGVHHIFQYEFDDLKGLKGGNLRFDFAILKDNKLFGLVEYDGIFHYEKQYNDDNFETIQKHDKLKNEYCEKNNLLLLRIPYWNYDELESILNNFLHKNHYY